MCEGETGGLILYGSLDNDSERQDERLLPSDMALRPSKNGEKETSKIPQLYQSNNGLLEESE